MLEKLKAMAKNGRQKSKSFTPSGGYMGASSFGSTMACYRSGSYDNTFPNVTRIAEQFAGIMPYAVDANGERLSQTPQLITALYNPNREMSGVEFFEAIMVMALVHPTVYILCHGKDGRPGNITRDNIGGFTFLENPSVNIDPVTGRTSYIQGSQHYTDDEVISISINVNPYSIISGYSPSMASKKWANVDDCVADYQAGFFYNNAKPAGIMTITAKDAESFNEMVTRLQNAYTGPSNNNKIVYVHKPISQIDGKPLNSQIEWTPMAQANKDLGLKDLFDQANKKIDMDFGVPQEIKGYLSNSNYASVNVAERIFDKYVVLPKAIKIWSKFTHEMNRITGGLGFAISFDYEISSLADEDKVRAEIKQLNFNILQAAVNAGYSLESAVESLDLPKELKNLTAAPQNTPETPVAEEVANDTISQLETSQKAVKCLKRKTVESAKWASDNPELKQTIEGYMNDQIDAAIEDKEFNTTKESKRFSSFLWAALAGVVLLNGEEKTAEGRELASQAGATPEILDKITDYAIKEDFRSTYQKYLDDVALSFTNDSADSIKRCLEAAEEYGWTESEKRDALREIMNTDEWRVQRLGRTEQHRAELMGGLDAMKQLSEETGITIYKVWHLNPESMNHCDICKELDGQLLPLDDSFGMFPAGTGEVADAHPNCLCYLTYEFEGIEPIESERKSVKVTCPKCGRYLFESEGGNAKNVICSNSKCKRHWDFDIKDGQINSKELK